MTSDGKQGGPLPGTLIPMNRSAGERCPREVTSAELLGDGREIHIRHGGAVYTLRRTSSGKLILTK